MPNTFSRRVRDGGVIVATIGTVLALGGPPASAAPTPVPHQWATLVNLGLLPGGTASIAELAGENGIVIGQATNSAGYHHAVRWDRTGRITDLGTLPGHTQSHVAAMNSAGQLVGISNAPALISDFAVKWDQNGRITSLAPPGSDTSQAVDINDAGAIAGQVGTAEFERAVRWSSDGAIAYLPTLAATPISTSVGISEGGTVAGLVRSGEAGGPMYAARWRLGGGLEVLDYYQGGPSMWPVGIDDTDAMYGTAGTAQGQRAVRWTAAGDVADLPVPPGATESLVTQVTAGGTVLGLVITPDGQYAARWDSSGTLTVLDNAPGSANGFPNGINANGVVVGQVTMPNYTTFAARWDNQGRVTLLSRLPNGSYATANAIDDRGTAVGYAATPTGYPHAVAWPEGRRR